MNDVGNFEMPTNGLMSFNDLVVASLNDSPIVQSIAQTADVSPGAIRCPVSDKSEQILLSKGTKGMAVLLATTSNERLIEDTLGLADNTFLPYLAYNNRISEKHLDALVYAAIDRRNVDIVVALLRGRKDFGTLLSKYDGLGDLMPIRARTHEFFEDFALFLILSSLEEFEMCQKYCLDMLKYDQWSAIVNSALKLVPKFPVSVDKYKSLLVYGSLECVPQMYKVNSFESYSKIYSDFLNKASTYTNSELYEYLSCLEPYAKRNILKMVESNPYSTYEESFAVLLLASMGHYGRLSGANTSAFLPQAHKETPEMWSGPTRLWVARHCANSLGSYEEYTVFAKLLPEWVGTLYNLLEVSKTL